MEAMSSTDLERLAEQHLPGLAAGERREFAEYLHFLLQYPEANPLRAFVQSHDA